MTSAFMGVLGKAPRNKLEEALLAMDEAAYWDQAQALRIEARNLVKTRRYHAKVRTIIIIIIIFFFFFFFFLFF